MTINVTIASPDGSEFDIADYLFNSTITAVGAGFINLAYNQQVLGQDIHLVLQGAGLSYSVSGEATSGTITGILITLDDDVTPVAEITGLNIPAAQIFAAMQAGDGGASMAALLFESDDFNYFGNKGSDLFSGGSKNDVIDGGAGDDELYGLAGDDLITGGAGADKIDGGQGNDTASYANSATPVTINLFTGTGTDGDAEGDTFAGIENVVGSAGNDELIGDDNDNVLSGGAGADTLDGGKGSDTAAYAGSDAAVTVSLLPGAIGTGGHAQGDILKSIENLTGSDFADVLTGDDNDNVIEGGKGADVLVGNGGIDTLSYRNSVAAITLTLGAAGALTTGTGAGSEALGDKVSGFENVIGGLGNDVINGNELANRLDGGAGNDILKANLGDDTLLGGLGIDSLDGGAGNDLLIGGAGADVIVGGDGAGDTASYADSNAAVTVALGLNGAVGPLGVGGSAEGDKISFVENLIGSAHNDVLTGNNLANVIEGGDGDDVLDGGTNPAGAGDTVSYASATGAVFVDLTLQGSAQDTVSSGIDTLKNFENIIGSAFDDTLTGDAGDNVIEGGAGADTLDGGGGKDTLSYAGSSAAVTVALDIDGAGIGTGGDAEGDDFKNFVNILGSAFNDTLTGNDGANVLTGGAGDDLLQGGAGNDTIDGGAGTGDTVSFVDATTGVTLTLGANGVLATTIGGDVGVDKVVNVENIIGGSGDDKLTGNAFDNIIEGGAGNDTLDGGLGNDTLSFANSLAAVTVDLSNATVVGGFIQIDLGGGEIDKIRGFEAFLGTQHNDKIIGDGLNNIIDGGARDDVLDGKGGFDTVSYASSQGDGLGGGVSVVLGEQGVESFFNGVVGVESDTLVNFENIIGSSFDDTLIGNTGINSIKGGAGADSIDGGAGNDVLEGGDGDDTLVGGAGADTLDGGNGVDTVDYSGIVNAAHGVTVALGLPTALVTVISAVGSDAAGDKLKAIENVIGGDGDDVLTGNALANVLTGGDGNDTLIGLGDADVIDGGAGDDTVRVGTQ